MLPTLGGSSRNRSKNDKRKKRKNESRRKKLRSRYYGCRVDKRCQSVEISIHEALSDGTQHELGEA
jgi:hypothetical protein